MSSETPPDDFSLLPTADGELGASSATPPPAARKQTRIGPRSSADSSPPTQEETEGMEPVSSEWSDLIHQAQETVPFTPVSSSRLQAETMRAESDLPPAAPTTKRTVISPRPNPATMEASLPPEPPPQAKASGAAPTPPRQTAAVPKQPPQKTISAVPSTKSTERPESASTLEPSDKAPPTIAGETESPELKTPPSIATPKPGTWKARWERWGGRALTMSVIIHTLLIAGGATYVVKQVMAPKQVDFLPGGGSQQGAAASQDLEHKIQQKKTPWLKKPMPMQKIGVANSVSDIILPDDVPDLMNLPDSKDFLSSKLSGSMGLSGLGSGMNKAIGPGSHSGMVFQPFSLFGMQIKSKRLGLVLDVSTSMAPHLPRVIEEVDKVAKGSVVILYFGCGLMPPPPGGLEGDEVYSTSGQEFEKFWRLGGATVGEARAFRINSKQPIPSEEIYRLLARRPQTYFIHNVGLQYTWLALLNDKLRTADGIYWFSDFQDRVEFKQLLIVRENLERRKQRLYMHAYQRGESFDLVKTQLVDPTRGDVTVEE